MEESLYDTLRGNWNINRVIDDRHADQQAFFTGHASFEEADLLLMYGEDGELSIGSTKMRASRRYIWLLEGENIKVSYENGLPFHEFKVSDGKAKAKHLCGDDIYYAEYSFYLQDSWRVIWTVNGPRKDYTSTTVYSR